eukprot:5706739-Prymnesium_polylepis.1
MVHWNSSFSFSASSSAFCRASSAICSCSCVLQKPLCTCPRPGISSPRWIGRLHHRHLLPACAAALSTQPWWKATLPSPCVVPPAPPLGAPVTWPRPQWPSRPNADWPLSEISRSGTKPSRGAVDCDAIGLKHQWQRPSWSAANASQQCGCSFGPFSSPRGSFSSTSGQNSSSSPIAPPAVDARPFVLRLLVRLDLRAAARAGLVRLGPLVLGHRVETTLGADGRRRQVGVAALDASREHLGHRASAALVQRARWRGCTRGGRCRCCVRAHVTPVFWRGEERLLQSEQDGPPICFVSQLRSQGLK